MRKIPTKCCKLRENEDYVAKKEVGFLYYISYNNSKIQTLRICRADALSAKRTAKQGRKCSARVCEYDA